MQTVGGTWGPGFTRAATLHLLLGTFSVTAHRGVVGRPSWDGSTRICLAVTHAADFALQQ
jgi:hypothetical protein